MKNIPEIRIKGFEGEWKEKRLEDVAPLQRGFDLPTSQLEKGPYPVVYSNGIGYYHKYYKCKAPGLVTGRSGTIGHFTYIRDGYYWPHNTTLWVTDFKGNEPLFIEYLYKNKHFENFMMGSGVPTLNRNEIHKEHSAIPNLAEQQSLGSFFSSFDRLLSDHHRRLENLRRVKKSMLQKMFPQQGQTVPEIRFKGFSGEWEKAKLSDIASFSKGRGYSKNDLTTKGNGKPIILYGRMYTNYEFVINNVDTYARPLPNSVYSTGKEVIVPASGETAEDISIASAVISKGIILGGDLNIILPYDDILYPPFLALYITNSNVHYELSLKAQGKTIVHLHNDALEDLEILVPPISEQQRLSSFFTSLDNLINDEVNYIDQLTRVKSTLLQKMFV